MPETVATWLATNFAIAEGAATIIAYTATAVVVAGYGDHQRKKAHRRAAAMARANFNESLEDRLVMAAMAQAPRSRVYGRVRNVDGIVFKGTHGTHKEFYTLVVALAGHEVDAIEQVYFDEKAVTLDGSGYVQTAPWMQERPTNASAEMTTVGGAGSITLDHTPIDGTVFAVTTVGGAEGNPQVTVTPTVDGDEVTISGAPIDGTWTIHYQWGKPDSRARVRLYTGAAGQNLYSDLHDLVGDQVEATDHFDGIACLLVTLQHDQDAFYGGVPSISAVMRGARIHDPRTSSTAWSENPALIARDWSLFANGGACDEAELADASFIAAANACDVSTTFDLEGGGSETRALYQCGIVCKLNGSVEPTDELAEMCEAMAGQFGWSGGKLTVRAGVYRAPVASLTEDWCTSVEAIEIVPAPPMGEAVNVYRPTFADAAAGYVASPAPEVGDDDMLAADGRELAREITLGAVTRAVHAQHVCGVLLREAREGLTVRLPCNLRAFELELFDVVAVTLPRFGWSAKEFEVTGWSFTLSGGVMLTLRETAAAVFDPAAIFAETLASDNTNLPRPTAVPEVTGLEVVSGTLALTDGTVMTRGVVTWDAVPSEAVAQAGRVEVQYLEAVDAAPDGDWPSLPSAAGRATQMDWQGLKLGAYYLFRARARNSLGMAGNWCTPVLHQVHGNRATRIYRQDSEPDEASSVDGDEWFDTDDGNKHYVLEGGGWVAVTVGTGALAADAATEVLPANTAAGTFPKSTIARLLLDGIVFTPADDCYAEVTVEMDAHASGGGSDWGAAFAGVGCIATAALSDNGDDDYIPAASDTPGQVLRQGLPNSRAHLTFSERFTCSGGVEYRAGAMLKGQNPDFGIFFYAHADAPPVTNVTLIKR